MAEGKQHASRLRQPGTIRDHRLIGTHPDEDLRAEMEMFGRKASRGFMLVSLLLKHYAAYRMQLFLYLKASGRAELNTMNLWVRMDGG
ncbi:MAG: hypothetical protein EXQ57_04735 [Bryobacterales bacterium]|nr:hypothetical protein [Bryobacterales bacterium]